MPYRRKTCGIFRCFSIGKSTCAANSKGVMAVDRKTIIKTDKLSKSFSVSGKQYHIIKNLDLEIYEGFTFKSVEEKVGVISILKGNLIMKSCVFVKVSCWNCQNISGLRLMFLREISV